LDEVADLAFKEESLL